MELLYEMALAAGGAIVVPMLILGVYMTVKKERLELLRRLDGLKSRALRVKDEEDELAKPLMERIGKPLLNKWARLGNRFMPSGKKQQLTKKLIAAGNPGGLTANEFLALQLALGIALALASGVGMMVLDWREGQNLPVMPLFVGLAGLIGFLFPETYLTSLTKKRQEAIQKDLPDVLDLLTVSVEAGLGFDGAIQRVTEKMKGQLADEFGRVLQEAQMGKPRREALKDMAARNGVDDLSSFVGAMVQADQLGVAIGNVLRLQSEAMRLKRRQYAEEKAMKAPIKMLFPLVLFVFPTIFIVLLGPAAIKIVTVMK